MSHAPPTSAAATAGKGSFGMDLIAGLTAAAVVIPKSMAYATVAGLPIVVGLYTAFVPMVVYALLGSSRVMSVSTTTTLAILTGAELALVVPDADPTKLLTASATLAVLAGLFLMLAGVLRLGVVANFISDPVLTGFKAGIGLVIVLDQVPKLLGVHFKKAGFFHNLWALAESLPDTSMLALGIGAGVIVALILLERLLPRLPAPLLALGGAIGASAAFGLGARGIETVGVIPRGFPSFVLPDLHLIEQLLPSAAGIALMSFVESIAVGRAFARTDEPPVRANRELLATGAANLAGAFFGSMPAGGGTSQTALVRAVGGRSQTASLVTAGTALLVMLLLAPVLGLIPNSALAALVIVYSVGLIQPSEFLAIRKIRTMEYRWALVACLGVPLFGTLQGIVLSIGMSLLAMLAQASNPRLSILGRKPGTDIFRPNSPEHPEDESFPGLLLVRPEDRIFFGNVQTIREKLYALVEERKPRVLGLDMRIVPDIEYSALKILIEAEKKAAERGIQLWLIGLSSEVLLVVQRCGLADRLGREGMFFNCQSAVAHYQSLPAPEPPKTAGAS